MNEHQLETHCLDWFREAGWEVLPCSAVAPDGVNPQRKSSSEVVLMQDLHDAFIRINPHLPAEHRDLCFEQVLTKLNRPESLDLITNNREFHRFLIDGVPVEYKVDNEPQKDQAFLVDFENFKNNRFVVINQVNIAGTKQMRRPDIICFVNGLPFAVVELKNPINENIDIEEAFNQLQTYKDELSSLFIFNEALVISDGYTARVGSLTANTERFMPWRDMKKAGQQETGTPQLEWQLETLVRDFFDRERFLEYIRFFVLFEDVDGCIIKKIAGYHQVHAVNAAIKSTIVATQELPAVPEQHRPDNKTTGNHESDIGNKKAGVVWHTQGSGKSFSMVCYAGKLIQQAEMNNPTLVVVTDRNDLDNQLFSTFANATELLRQTPVQANDRQTLRRLLAERESGGIIFTTVQKFTLLEDETKHPVLNARHNIVVISDEAHRSQYDTPGNTLRADGTYGFSHAKHLRDALPSASFIGFTGTPISNEDKDTRAVFGDYVSIYDIKDAVNDKATVGIYYESRLAKLDINHDEIEALSEQVEELLEDEEDIATRQKTKSKWAQLEKLVGAEPRLQQVAEDLVAHFEARTEIVKGKAMIVAMSRSICVQLYDKIVEIRPDWHDSNPENGSIKIIMTGSAADVGVFQPHIYNKDTKKRLAKRFKNPADPLKLVIIRDMWLTGFDVPCCHTMYVDKPMKGHNLMQAIARVNRVFRDKEDGLVVDYIGIASELKYALKIYADADGKGEPTLKIEHAFKILQEKITILRNLFAKTPEGAGLDISAFETDPLSLFVSTANYILSLKDGKKRFFDAVLATTKAYSLCSTMLEAKSFRKEIAFYSAIKASISKFTGTGTKRSQADKNSILKQILDNAVIADGVADLFDLCHIKNANIGLLSDEFLEEVSQLPYRNLAIELLEKLLNDKIRSKERNNIVQERNYAERLKETLRKYNNRAIETAEVINALIQIAKDFQEELLREEKLGLNSDEIAFYTALANNESAVRELGDETLKKIAIEITEKLRKSTTVDWQVRDSVRAELRILVRRTLQRWKYPPDKTPEAVDLVLEQAEALSNAWTK